MIWIIFQYELSPVEEDEVTALMTHYYLKDLGLWNRPISKRHLLFIEKFSSTQMWLMIFEQVQNESKHESSS